MSHIHLEEVEVGPAMHESVAFSYIIQRELYCEVALTTAVPGLRSLHIARAVDHIETSITVPSTILKISLRLYRNTFVLTIKIH